MAEVRSENSSPREDSCQHLALEELEAGFRALPKSPKDSGRLVFIVCRRADGGRDTPECVHLTPEEGVPGDRWNRNPPRDPEAQITVMRHDVALLIANGQPLAVFGDNLFVDLDISTANLPAGTRLKVGKALVEVTPMPHDGCRKFKDRFGADALRFVNAKPTRPQNLRGIYWKVIEAGEVRIGDFVKVLNRPGAKLAGDGT